jgi:hypothetical protein
MDHLIAGLQPLTLDGSISTTISILSMCSCAFEKAATEKLRSFFQTQTFNMYGDVIYQSSLHQLCFRFPRFYGRRSASTTILSMLTVRSLNAAEHQSEHLLHTIGSQVRILSLVPGYGFGKNYLEAIMDNSSRLWFAHLQLEWLSSEDITKLFKKLTVLPLLRELSITSSCGKIDSKHPMIKSLGENGFLHDLSIRETRRSRTAAETSLMDNSAMKLVTAYCHRNRFLPRFLGTQVLDHLAIQENNEDTTFEDKGDPLLYPALLMVARQTPMTHLPLLFNSLMVRGESIGLRTNCKRMATRA